MMFLTVIVRNSRYGKKGQRQNVKYEGLDKTDENLQPQEGDGEYQG